MKLERWAVVGVGVMSLSGAAHGQLYAPHSVAASDGWYASRVSVTWDAVRGASLYRVLRNSVNDVNTAVSIGTTPDWRFFDTTATPGQTNFYFVRAENGAQVGPVSAGDSGFRAVGINAPPPNNPLPPPPIPAGNPSTAAKAMLGKALFFEEQLSSNNAVACATCHISGAGSSDPRSLSMTLESTFPGPDGFFGTADDVRGSMGVPLTETGGAFSLSELFGIDVQVTNRRSKSAADAAYAQDLFWDGRASRVFRDPETDAVVLPAGGGLETQSLAPLISSAEMAHIGRTIGDVIGKLEQAQPLALSPDAGAAMEQWINGRSYPDLFSEVFGTPEITGTRIALAIATYERQLFSDRTNHDLALQQIVTPPPSEQRGRGLFQNLGCAGCHAGPTFTDNIFHYIGVRPQNDDLGRFTITGAPLDRGAFRTPSLRNVGLRGPYMHNGRFNTLEEVVAFYNRGGDFNAPNKPPVIRPLGLNAQQQADLVAFLRNQLTDARVRDEAHPFDRPVLYSETGRVPAVFGSGWPGADGLTPRVVAIEPPIAGNPAFTVAVGDAPGGATAVLVIDDVEPSASVCAPPAGAFGVSVTLQGVGAGNGFGSATLQLDGSLGSVGTTLFGRWYVVEDGGGCGSDLTGDGVVNAADLAHLLGSWGANEGSAADLNGDGQVNAADLAQVLGSFGAVTRMAVSPVFRFTIF